MTLVSAFQFPAPVDISAKRAYRTQYSRHGVSRSFSRGLAPMRYAPGYALPVKMEAEPNKKDKGGMDWDSDWKEFQDSDEGKAGGGVFKLDDTSSSNRNPDFKVDDRTERLTDAWSSSNGFLIGIGVIAVIALLEGYVWFQSQANM